MFSMRQAFADDMFKKLKTKVAKNINSFLLHYFWNNHEKCIKITSTNMASIGLVILAMYTNESNHFAGCL